MSGALLRPYWPPQITAPSWCAWSRPPYRWRSRGSGGCLISHSLLAAESEVERPQTPALFHTADLASRHSLNLLLSPLDCVLWAYMAVTWGKNKNRASEIGGSRRRDEHIFHGSSILASSQGSSLLPFRPWLSIPEKMPPSHRSGKPVGRAVAVQIFLSQILCLLGFVYLFMSCTISPKLSEYQDLY